MTSDDDITMSLYKAKRIIIWRTLKCDCGVEIGHRCFGDQVSCDSLIDLKGTIKMHQETYLDNSVGSLVNNCKCFYCSTEFEHKCSDCYRDLEEEKIDIRIERSATVTNKCRNCNFLSSHACNNNGIGMRTQTHKAERQEGTLNLFCYHGFLHVTHNCKAYNSIEFDYKKNLPREIKNSHYWKFNTSSRRNEITTRMKKIRYSTSDAYKRNCEINSCLNCNRYKHYSHSSSQNERQYYRRNENLKFKQHTINHNQTYNGRISSVRNYNYRKFDNIDSNTRRRAQNKRYGYNNFDRRTSDRVKSNHIHVDSNEKFEQYSNDIFVKSMMPPVIYN